MQDWDSSIAASRDGVLTAREASRNWAKARLLVTAFQQFYLDGLASLFDPRSQRLPLSRQTRGLAVKNAQQYTEFHDAMLWGIRLDMHCIKLNCITDILDVPR